MVSVLELSSNSLARLRRRLLEFLLHPPRKAELFNDDECWLLNPLTESNLQLFALVSIWISSKLHDSRPLSVKSLKSLGDVLITDQCFTTRDFAEAERVFMEVQSSDVD
ncbi:hypothetical protein HPP92_016406 [Vanilla planifolia]|uniref:Cyclin N-terminal domain-containing protein n=1 Tax=Vanilla planifolia TaxID=51239 RepID=A0A835US39_VANPL|nr:hypothetical protein HPP92_016406 [Vanilla planifolia]